MKEDYSSGIKKTLYFKNYLLNPYLLGGGKYKVYFSNPLKISAESS
jgi:hypothetical protein